MSFGNQINFKQLLERHGRIQVPMIQRDYAQGRQEQKEVRDEFLRTLQEALAKPIDDPSLPLNLDFIYGSVEGEEHTRFLPLDGQQRLTTLFLLHWYTAWMDEQWPAFDELFRTEGRSRFSYSVRPSSTEFFDQFVNYRPACMPGDVADLAALIADQPWYFRSWRLDPTIQAVLNMLNAIHEKFGNYDGLFTRLVDDRRPAITFQLLDLINFGLSDDLYIKMNARGKPLTPFETFKARYEQALIGQLQEEAFSIGTQAFKAADYIAIRLDTTWADLFWKHRSAGSDNYDSALMNVFRAVALISRSPESPNYLEDFGRLRARINPPSYTLFHSCNWLDESFTQTLMRLLDSWCADDGDLRQLLPDGRYFDENAFFASIVSSGASRSYTEIVQLVAYTQFVVKHHGLIEPKVFQEWMRIVRNLSVNTGYNRPDDSRRSVRGLLSLLEHSSDVLGHFAHAEKVVSGFSESQVAEEKLKAQLMLAHDGWRLLIDRAESHGYFLGQIGFLLDFAGVNTKASRSSPGSWGSSEHADCQEVFLRHLGLAEEMFAAEGLIDAGEHLWQRALLCIDDYLLPSGRNRSFLVNAVTEEASWKRLLGGEASLRTGLKNLFNRLSLATSISAQLEHIIRSTTGLDPWREAIVHCPAVLDFCRNRLVRVDEHERMYLLKRSQMNGAHAELFTFCLYEKLRSRQVMLSCFSANYEFVTDTYSQPYLSLRCIQIGVTLRIELNAASKYMIRLALPLGEEAAATDLLVSLGFEKNEPFLQLAVERSKIDDFLLKLDTAICSWHEKVKEAD